MTLHHDIAMDRQNENQKIEVGVDVSVIMLTYNHKDYIKTALDSVLSQKTSCSFEILVSDDASTDGTDEIVLEYAKKYPGLIRAFIREKNLGSVKNGYLTAKAARGRYLTTCEGDDFWTDPEKIQKQFEFMNEHPQYSGCVHLVGLVDKNGQRLKGKKLGWFAEKKTFSLADFKGVVLPGHIVSMMRRNYFLDAEFDSDFILRANQSISDRTCALLWLARGDFYCMDQEMACYRYVKRGKNLTSRLYMQSQSRFERDYEYTLVLEDYAERVLKVDGGFRYHKRELFVKACIYTLMHPRKAQIGLIKRIIADADSKIWYIWGFFPFVFSRFQTIVAGKLHSIRCKK